MPRCKTVVPSEERRPAVVKRTEWASPEEEAVMVSRVEEPACGLLRFWIILITGGTFHVFLAYSLIGCLFSEFQAMATLRDYLSLKCVIPDDVDLDPKPEQQPPSYIFGSHPHGIHAFGCSALNFAGNDMARYFPRVWHRLTGAIASALRMWMVNTLRVCVPIFWGVAGTPCPYERPVTTVVGAPIHVEWTLHPHPALVEDAYCRYVDALERLYETHKAAAGYPADRNLHVTRDPPASKETLANEAAAFRARLIHKLGPEDGRITFADAEQRARDALGEDAVPAPAEPKKER
ncbi:hypothetical protein FNF29_08317 [Cafeteria roenbergensis]|uniref:diacylglycerol O-acyltransferase n=1 Tax=Cafeteria roenbergensis TaxID=33653 RepID=A0A5A8C253_CAFRO|nr:hypothetical protein FNF29_08317 [Cafeteria roenbergensis]|eukprot:KAA0145981.1 hypothetical protein FNF29_08317 [Cafeteria roenbergensis]